MKPKFRVWDKRNKRMISWEEICNSDEFTHYYLNEEFSDISEPMQYTRLKDYEGQEIYEGDILKIKIKTTGKYLKGIIEYKNGSYMIETGTMFLRLHQFANQEENIEIIGNKFENDVLVPEVKE